MACSLFSFNVCLFVVLFSTYCRADITCGSNEIVDDCPSLEICPAEYCPKSANEKWTCSSTPPDPCPPAVCKCAFNHRRAENGTCISTRDCPPFDCSCRVNEEYNPCPPYCPTDDCSQATPDGRCPIIFGRIGIILECNPTCRCKKGFWRQNGICIPYAQCPGKSTTD